MTLHTTLVRNSMSCHNLFRIIISLAFISILLHTTSASNSSATTNALKTYRKFIKDRCNSTTYPDVCYKALSPYASKIKTNPLALTKISIHLVLNAAKSASSTLKKLSKSNKGKLTHAETAVIADCRENIDVAVDLLQESADSMDEFDELHVRPSLQKKIKPNVAYVAWLNSIALALVNRLRVSKYILV